MNFADVRAKYPQYDDLSDEQLGRALHRKFYSDMPYDQFAEKVGLSMPLGNEANRAPIQEMNREFSSRPEPKKPFQFNLVPEETPFRKAVQGISAAALPKLAGGMFEFAALPFRSIDEALGGGGAASYVPNMYARAQELENVVAGEDLSENIPAKMASTAIQSAIFPGSALRNVVAGESSLLSSEAAKGLGLPAWAQVAAGLVGGVGGAKTYDTASRMPRVPSFTDWMTRRRINDAFSDVAPSELTAARAAEQSAIQSGGSVRPWQAFDRDIPKLHQLDAEIMGSASPRAVQLQAAARQQIPQANALNQSVAGRLAPKASISESAEQLTNAADLAAGGVRRTPNVLTKPLYEKASEGVRGIAKTDSAAILDRLGAMRLSAAGNLELEKRMDDLIAQYAKRTGSEMKPDGTWKIGKQLSVDEAQNLVESFKNSLKDFSVNNPNMANFTTQSMDEALGFIESAAQKAQPALEKAKAAQRGLRQDFRVGPFDPLEKGGKASGEAANVIESFFKRGSTDPNEFAWTVRQVADKDINAVPNVLGHYVKNVLDKASANKGAFADEMAPIRFVNDLIGSPAKESAFRSALEASARADKIQKPAEYATSIIEQLRTAARMSRNPTIDYSRLGVTNIGPVEVGKAAFGNTLMAHNAISVIANRLINRSSDARIAELMSSQNPIDAMLSFSGKQRGLSFRPLPLEMLGAQAMQQLQSGER